jgi:hypothetical protein
MAAYVPKTILVNVTSIVDHAVWYDAGNPSDPWAHYPYQWQVTFNVTPQTHSDPATPIPFNYTGLDIAVGDWIIFTDIRYLTVQIVSIVSQSDGALTVVVEDVDRFNLYNDPTQAGVGIGIVSPPGVYDTVVFSIGPDGMPSFANFPSYTIPIDAAVEINNRFQFRNYAKDYVRVYQPSNNFSTGNAVYLDSSGVYHAASSTNNTVQRTVGVVTSINQPGTGWFTYRPIARLVNNLPTLPGLPGDVLYAGATAGVFSSTAPVPYTKPMYLKITDTSALLLAEVPNSISSGVDVDISAVSQGSLLMYQSASNTWVALNQLDHQVADGGYF